MSVVARQPATLLKTRAAGLSILSNTVLIALKVAAGVLTGSIAIVTEAVHSSIDLIASLVTYVSVRKADEPADESHPYGHQKVENLSAAFEGMLIVLGAVIIIYEALGRLAAGAHVERLGFGAGVAAFSALANLVVSAYLYRRAEATGSAALAGDAAHLRADAATSFAVLVAFVLVAVTGAKALDPITALLVAGAIVLAGVRLVTRSSRVLVDEALPDHELGLLAATIDDYGAPEVVGFHKLRARRAGSRRYIDLHLQFRRGTSLERAHLLSHELQHAIRAKMGGADVLIHLEPEYPVGAGRGRER